MRSDLRDNTETISKMIQFGTVKYGIVKQLKDRTRSERDVIGDQEDGSSMPCSPVAECKIFTPETEIQTNASSPTVLDCRVDNSENADHNHNNNKNINTTDNHENEMHFENSEIKNEIPESFTYPEVELRKSPSPPTIQIPIPPAVGVSPPVDDGIVRDLNSSQDHNMSEDEHENEENEVNNHSQVGDYTDHISDDQPLKTVHSDDAVVDEVHQEEHQQNHQQINNSRESPPPTLPQFPAAPITLDVIQNMQMAIAQFAAKTLANGGANNEAAMKQLAFLQQTLFNLQQQQIFQMQLIQQLQSQLALNQIKGDGEENNEDEEDIDEDEQICPENLSNHKSDDDFEDGLKDGEGMDTMSQDSQMHDRRLSHEERERENGLENDMSQSELEKGDSLKDEDGEYCDNGLSDDHQNRSSLLHNNNNHITSNSVNSQGLEKGEIRSPYSNKLDENTPLPYGSDLASSIITNHDDPPSLDGPNSLEMLQKRAQEVLDSASQGILSGNLADEFAFGKDKNGDCKNRNEPFFKHRCRYCGKVFGSDSALQIHIRSHTGERPFKCNVCGSRFTTKGNLKVHFQRHSQKFPHVPMNATPIPEHLDKFHPPLLEQMSPESSPPHQPQMPHVPNVPVSLPLPFPPGAAFPGLPLYRPPLEILKSLGHYPTPFFGALPPMPPITLKRDQEAPTDLRKPSPPDTTPPIKTQEIKEEPLSLRIKEEKNEVERETSQILETHQPRIPPPPPPELPPIQPPLALVTQPAPSPLERSQDIPQPPEAKRAKSTTPPPSVPQPPPLPPSLLQVSQSLLQQSVPPPPVPPQHSPLPTQQQLPPTTNQLPSLIKREDFAQRLPLNYTRLSPDRRSPIRSPANIPRSPFLGPIKHEMTLLPRPHSNDNSWENFIEVSNTCETVKLKELMKNKKLTDPNQCVVCDRVLSCKSALQMHYRTHTGERPFKCRICGRAFTTKGNLKTHMAVHKIRPPMRNFHQCPVCHKKYSNALVLQQHIRLHTGEPTDLTPEQIQAAEIRDFPPTMMPGSFLNPFTFNFGLGGGGHPNGMMGSESSQGENEEGMDCSDDFDDDISDHMSNGGFSDRPKSSDDMKGMLFEQKLKIENNRPKSEASTSSAPTSPVSAINKSSPTPSDTSQGALDLTPRSSMPPHTPPNHAPPLFHHARPPFGMFPNLPLFPPVSSTAQNMCSAMNSIAQSVMPSAPFNPLALSGVRGSTTCGICFKTFPCHSALEIHYRSHTKERPFKCSICDRGFTTKGNLKQHMLTHKIRDMEQDAFRNRAIKYSTEQEQR